jgi:hypothetical protein
MSCTLFVHVCTKCTCELDWTVTDRWTVVPATVQRLQRHCYVTVWWHSCNEYELVRTQITQVCTWFVSVHTASVTKGMTQRAHMEPFSTKYV